MSNILVTITVYDIHNNIVDTYENVPIPVHAPWYSDAECLEYLRSKCPKMKRNEIYGVSPYHGTHPLYELHGGLWPEVLPILKKSRAWDLKVSQRGIDMRVYDRVVAIEQQLEAQNRELGKLVALFTMALEIKKEEVTASL